MKILKDYVRTYARPEASMAEGYVMSKTLGYCMEYMERFQGTSRRIWDDKKEQIMKDKVIQGRGWAHPCLRSLGNGLTIFSLTTLKY